MTPHSFLTEVCSVLDDFLSRKTLGSLCVRQVDALIADELPDGLPLGLLQSLHDFQSDLALYVEDAEARQEDAAYYGPDELRQRILAFKDQLA